MNIRISRIIIVVLSFLLLSQCKNGERFIGRLNVNGIDGVYFNLYQHDEFDYTTALLCEVVDDNDSILARKYCITGTLDYVRNLNYFSARCYDSIIFLTYGDSNVIYSLYDLKSDWGFPQGVTGDSPSYINRKAAELIEKLKQYNPMLSRR